MLPQCVQCSFHVFSTDGAQVRLFNFDSNEIYEMNGAKSNTQLVKKKPVKTFYEFWKNWKKKIRWKSKQKKKEQNAALKH